MPNIPQSELPRPKSWDEFEDIAWDLYTRLWDDPNARRYGRTGQAQQGVDIYGQPARLGGSYAGVQCKRYEPGTLTKAVVQAEIAKAETFDPPLGQFIIATTAPRDAKLQKAVRQINEHRRAAGQFSVRIDFWDDLSSHLSHPDHRDLLRKHYADWFIEAAAPIITTPSNLPAAPPDFVGRKKEIKRARDSLDRDGAIIISGMGGMGKTALALQVAHQLAAAGRFPDVQLYIDLKGTERVPLHPRSALATLLVALLGPDPQRPDDLDTLAQLWRDTLHNKRALVILDNAANRAQVRPLLPGSRTCAVLITSRQRFTLPGSALLDLQRMKSKDARRLLRTLARRLDAAAAVEIANFCGCLPLALRVAGNYMALNDDCPPGRYVTLLASERERLSQLRDPDDPDLDVQAVIALSLAQLDENTCRAWALLSLLSAPFAAVAAAALWGREMPIPVGALPEEMAAELPEGMTEMTFVYPLDIDETLVTLRALRNRSLVAYDPKTSRYHQHDLLRLAAAQHLEARSAAEIPAARGRLAQHYLTLVNRAAVSHSYPALDPDWPHLRAAMEYAAGLEDPSGGRTLIRLVLSIEDYLDFRGLSSQRVYWLQQAIVRARDMGDQRAENALLNLLGLARAALGEIPTAIEHYQRAQAIAREIGDRPGEANALGNLGMAHTDLGETRKAIEYYQEALDIARETGNLRSEGTRLGNLGVAYATLGEIHTAIQHYTDALAIARETGDRRGEGSMLDNLGLAYTNLGEARKAIEHYQDALAIAREIGNRRSESLALGNLGNAYTTLGEIRKAIEHYQDALAIARESGDRHGEGSNLANLGTAYAALGETRTAIQHYNDGLAIARETGNRRGEGSGLSSLGLAYAALGQPDRARDYLTQALAIFEAIEDPNAERVRTWLAQLDE